MTSRWVALFQGTIPEVITLQASCESIGIPTYVPDMNLIQADPFMRGANALALQLFVPEDRLDDARAFQERLAQERAADPERRAREPSPLEQLERLGRRARWCSVWGLFAPIGLWLGWRYIRATRHLEVKPQDHAWSVAAFWVSLATLATVLVMYGAMLLRR
jgi:hypothetical protein